MPTEDEEKSEAMEQMQHPAALALIALVDQLAKRLNVESADLAKDMMVMSALFLAEDRPAARCCEATSTILQIFKGLEPASAVLARAEALQVRALFQKDGLRVAGDPPPADRDPGEEP
jgi:hypothetical protein